MKNKSLISFIAACVLLVVAIVAYGAWYSLVSAKSAEVASLAQQIADQKQSSTRVAQATVELSKLATQESTVDQYFVATSDVVPFLEQLQSTGTYLGSNVQVDSVSANPGTPFGTLTLSLNITGTFDAVARTIGAIEYEPYDTKIQTLTFDKSNTDGTGSAASSTEWTASAVFSIGAQTGAQATSTTP